MADFSGERGAQAFAGAGEAAFQRFEGKRAVRRQVGRRTAFQVFFLQQQPVLRRQGGEAFLQKTQRIAVFLRRSGESGLRLRDRLRRFQGQPALHPAPAGRA